MLAWMFFNTCFFCQRFATCPTHEPPWQLLSADLQFPMWIEHSSLAHSPFMWAKPTAWITGHRSPQRLKEVWLQIGVSLHSTSAVRVPHHFSYRCNCKFFGTSGLKTDNAASWAKRLWISPANKNGFEPPEMQHMTGFHQPNMEYSMSFDVAHLSIKTCKGIWR